MRVPEELFCDMRPSWLSVFSPRARIFAKRRERESRARDPTSDASTEKWRRNRDISGTVSSRAFDPPEKRLCRMPRGWGGFEDGCNTRLGQQASPLVNQLGVNTRIWQLSRSSNELAHPPPPCFNKATAPEVAIYRLISRAGKYRKCLSHHPSAPAQRNTTSHGSEKRFWLSFLSDTHHKILISLMVLQVSLCTGTWKNESPIKKMIVH